MMRSGAGEAGGRAAALGLVTLLLLPAPVTAQEVGDCDTWQANARNVDWSDPSVTFGQGAIRLIPLDTGEPAAAAFHVMVTYPEPDDLYLDCRLISAGGGLGFPQISVANASATYDAARGLTISVPGLSVEGDALVITFTVNRATGEVTIP